MDTTTPRDEAASASADDSVTLHVCVSCRAGEDSDATPRAGLRLHDALVEAMNRQDGLPVFKIAAAECLSNCNRGCSAALTGRARWSYVYGDLNAALVDELLVGATAIRRDHRRPGAVARAAGDLAQERDRAHSAGRAGLGARRMSIEKVPVTIITGFLGSGKTTLVRHLMLNPQGRRLAVLVNEFGDLGIDGDILKGCADANCPEDAIVELTNGCLCCTVADDFVPTIAALLNRAQPPDHILIETSGLALPKPLLKAFEWPDLRARITVDGVIAVADAEAVADGRFAPDLAAIARQREADTSIDHDTPLGEVFEDQVACADIVILNKADLVDPARLATARDIVLAEAPRRIAVIEATEGKVDPRIVLGIGAAAENDLDARPTHHENHDAHDHDDFETIIVTLPSDVHADAIVTRMEAIARDHAVLRAKGYVAIAGKPMRLLVQGVGTRVRAQFDRPWRADEARLSRHRGDRRARPRPRRDHRRSDRVIDAHPAA